MSFKDELNARISGFPVERCLNDKKHKSHMYREYETKFCPGGKRRRKHD